MPEKNKCEEQKIENETEKDEAEKDVWSEDQKKRRYYYDDAHGYETYDPEMDEED